MPADTSPKRLLGFGPVYSFFIPALFASLAFAGGLVLLVSGALPSSLERLKLVRQIVPLFFLELSHFLGSLAGLFLLILARGLQQRLNAAYYLSVSLIVVGIVLSLVKGFHVEESLVLAVLLVVFLPARANFYRKASLFDEPFSLSWFAAIAVVVAGSAFLGLWSYRHIEYSHELWWRFEFDQNASRFLRAGIGTAVIFCAFGLASLLRPTRPRQLQAGESDLSRVYPVAAASKNSEAYRALFGDKAFFWSKTGRTFLMYRAMPRSLVALGDPVGPVEEWKELIFEFRAKADLYGADPVFSEISSEHLPIYLDMDLTVTKLGEKARVRLSDFDLEGGARSEFRRTLKNLESNAVTFEVVPKENSDVLLPDLKTVSDAWLRNKHVKEKGFSLGFFSEPYLRCCSHAIVRQNGTVVAFSNFWMGADREELSPDLVRYDPGKAPKGVMDYLIVKLILWAKENGSLFLNLGMAPLAGLENRVFSPIWSRAGAVLFYHSRQFYNFEGLRHYKEKFDPVWTPVYLASPGGLSIPRALRDIAILNSGSFVKMFFK